MLKKIQHKSYCYVEEQYENGTHKHFRAWRGGVRFTYVAMTITTVFDVGCKYKSQRPSTLSSSPQFCERGGVKKRGALPQPGQNVGLAL